MSDWFTREMSDWFTREMSTWFTRKMSVWFTREMSIWFTREMSISITGEMSISIIREMSISITREMSISRGGGGGEVSELTDRQGCAIFALEVVPKNLVSHKNPTQKFILQDFMLAISATKLCVTTNLSENGH